MQKPLITKEDYISYWLGRVEGANLIISEFSSNSKLAIRMRELASQRRTEAIEQLAKLGYQADSILKGN